MHCVIIFNVEYTRLSAVSPFPISADAFDKIHFTKYDEQIMPFISLPIIPNQIALIQTN